MLKIDYALLDEVGLSGLPADEKDRMLKHIYETLEIRVGMTLASQMSDEQLDEFEELAKTDDDKGALQWLESNFPNYKQVVESELGTLKQEISANSSAILAAANQ